MTILKLKSVRVLNAVPYEGAATTTLNYTKGSLEYDESQQLVIATPSKAGSIAKSIMIPLSNVVFFEVLDEKALAEKEAADKARIKLAVEEAKPKPEVDDTIRLTKNSR